MSPAGTPSVVLYTPPQTTCEGVVVEASAQTTFPVGTHDVAVTIRTPQQEPAECHASLIVVDTQPPVLTPKTTYLWPPNHKMASVSVGDCVSVADACDPDVRVFFTYATSDEPADSTGDGNTEGDIALGCTTAQLRSERKGNGDARVYTLGVRAIDASGHATDSACQVIVEHDQGGKGTINSGEAYRVEAPACP